MPVGTETEIKTQNNPVKLLFNLTETTASMLKKAVTDGIIIASEEKIENRMSLCYNCIALDKEQVRCKLCGCYMKLKVRFDAAKCPAGKW